MIPDLAALLVEPEMQEGVAAAMWAIFIRCKDPTVNEMMTEVGGVCTLVVRRFVWLSKWQCVGQPAMHAIRMHAPQGSHACMSSKVVIKWPHRVQ